MVPRVTRIETRARSAGECARKCQYASEPLTWLAFFSDGVMAWEVVCMVRGECSRLAILVGASGEGWDES